MTYQEIQELIKLISKSNLAEFKMQDGEFKLSIRTSLYRETKTTQVVSTPVPVPASVAAAVSPTVAAPAAIAPAAPPAEATESQQPAQPPTPKPAAADKKYLEIKSPMVGTFYRSSTPEKPAYVEIGQKIKKGDVVCIIEAMKLFNEIEADFGGKVVKVMVDNAQPVEYDQVLFLVEPD